VALEHARAIGSKALGQASAILLTVHNTPFGDIVDTEDDLQPLVFSMFRDAARAVRLVAAALGGAEFDTRRMAARASEGWITVTELADTLVRQHDVPFKAAHTIASRLITRGSARPGVGSLSAVLHDVSQEIIGRAIEVDDASLARILSPQNFVEVRRMPGGPAPSETAKAIAVSEARLAEDVEWFQSTLARLRAAEEALKSAVAAL
jgi:argininosuccinate lyase